MKKLFLVSAALVFAMFGLFTSCSDDGGSDDPQVSSTESVSVQKGSSISKSITVDLSDSALNSAGISAFSVGQDVTDLFVVSQVSSARTAVNTSSVTDFKAIVSDVSATSLSVNLTGTAPSEDCKIVAAIAIPAEYTEANEAVVKNAAVINVGEVSETNADNSSCSLSSFTKITDISELNGKILESSQIGHYTSSSSDGTEDYGTIKTYYLFDKDGSSVTEYSYEYSSVTGKLADVDEYIYEFEEGRITDENGEEYIGTVYSKNGKYYIINDEYALSRKSGSGLCATFGASMNGDDYSYEMNITFYTDGTISGKSSYKDNEDGTEYSENYFYTGTYENNDGILSCDIKTIAIYSDDSEEVTEISQFAAGLLYDGSKLYSLDACTVVSELPEDTTASN